MRQHRSDRYVGAVLGPRLVALREALLHARLAFPCAHAVVKVRSGKNDGANNREYPISSQTKAVMGERCTDVKSEHSQSTDKQYPGAPVVAESKPKRNDAQRHNDDQHLGVQVTFGKLRKKWKPSDKNR